MAKRTLVLVAITHSDGSEDGAVLWTYADGGSAMEALAANRTDGTMTVWTAPLNLFQADRWEARRALEHPLCNGRTLEREAQRAARARGWRC